MNKNEDFFENKKRVGKYNGQFNIEVGSYAFKDLFVDIPNNESFIRKILGKSASKNFITVITNFEVIHDQRKKGLGNKMLNHVISESNFSTIFLVTIEESWIKDWLENKGFVQIPSDSPQLSAFIRNKR